MFKIFPLFCSTFILISFSIFSPIKSQTQNSVYLLNTILTDIENQTKSKFCTFFSIQSNEKSNSQDEEIFFESIIHFRTLYNNYMFLTFNTEFLLKRYNKISNYYKFRYTRACSLVVYVDFNAFELVNRKLVLCDIFPGGVFGSYHLYPQSNFKNVENSLLDKTKLRHVAFLKLNSTTPVSTKHLFPTKHNWNLKPLIQKIVPGQGDNDIQYFKESGQWSNYILATLYHTALNMNATLKFEMVLAMPSRGKLPTGEWDQFVQPLVEGLAQTSAVIEPTYYPRDILYPSKMILYAKIVFYTALPRAKMGNSFEAFTHPFSFHIWTAILTSLVALFGVVFLSSLIPSSKHLKFSSPNRKQIAGTTFMTVFRPILDQSGIGRNLALLLQHHNSWRVFIIWALLIMILSSVYKSQLISALVRPSFVYAPRTFQELANSSFKIMGVFFSNNMEVALNESKTAIGRAILLRATDAGWPAGTPKDILKWDSVCLGYSVVMESYVGSSLTSSDGQPMYKLSDDGILSFAAAIGISVYSPDVLGVDRQDSPSSTVGNIRPPGTSGAGPPGIAAALSASVSGVDDEESLDPATMPYFDYGVTRNVSTVVGQHAFILCRIHRMDDRSVSWIRKRDLHILTAGVYTYTTDQRFVVLHPEKSENWTLQIKYPQVRDSGVYECQVNTEPKISMAFHLSVIESRARIIGGTDIHVQSGSSLRLTCEVEHSPHDIAQVFWYHGTSIIDPQGMYGEALTSGIQIVTQRSDILRSQLTIVKVRSNHSGNYTCSPTMSDPASVIVHVISGEHPAERLQRGNRSSSSLTHLRSFEYFILYASLRLFMLIHSICIKDCVSTQIDSR